MKATFKKPERLTGKKLLEEIHRSGAAIKVFPFVLLYLPMTNPQTSPARLAISVPKRRVHNAVDRNQIKRLIREAYRKQKQPLYDLLTGADLRLGMLLIFVGNPEEIGAQFVNEKISHVLMRLMKELSQDQNDNEN